MNVLVGYTGFVGSNLYREGNFQKVFNSVNINEAFGLQPELLVYAGVRAEKYLANSNPLQDRENIENAFAQIRKIRPEKLVLISTVDVYGKPFRVDEKSEIRCGQGGAYGANRYLLEQMVREEYPDALIIRLPGLYGENLKKNFIYDYMHKIPAMLKEEKYKELSLQSPLITKVYQAGDNGFFRYMGNPAQEDQIRGEFMRLGFTSLSFTDSRSSFQFYPLRYLWKHMCISLEASLKLINITTQPVRADELYYMWEGKKFVNEISPQVPCYDCRSLYAEQLGGKDGYIFNKEFIKTDLLKFIQSRIRGKGDYCQ